MQRFKYPLILLLGVLIGMTVSNLLNKRAQTIQLNTFGSGSKIEQLLNYADKVYVDTLDMEKLTEDIMSDFIAELDPHSSYIPAKDLEIVNSQLEGSFSGIGVQFNIQNDTIMIVGVIRGGPSERVGILAGDRIVTVNDSVFVGDTINNEKVMHTLRGEKGTEVKIGIKRYGADELLDYTVVRGDIPITSVDVSYMITPEIGVIRVNKFGETTYTEFLTGLAKLRNEGAKKYIIDLRENSGGYMDQAINMVNEFLEEGSLIVYSEGKSYPRYEAHANGRGSFQKVPLIVLQDEFSASASEIFAGAMQDNDRALIIGRRSFGKGLVQQQFPFSDGSAMRLTVARYYTPAGRSIQKPYELGKGEDYEMDIVNRFMHGEFYTKDSIQFNDSTMFSTKNGRRVYGGGGIMPDVFVARDTLGGSVYLNNVVNKGLTYQFALQYTDQHRAELNKMNDWKAMNAHLDKQKLLNTFVEFANEKGVKPNYKQIRTSEKIILNHLKSYIIRNILDDEGFFPMYFDTDNVMQTAVKELQKIDSCTIEN